MKLPFRIAFVAFFVPCLSSCNPGMATIDGKVTYKGKPVVFGTVLVISADGLPKSGPINPDGTFQIENVRTGPAKVAVSSMQPPGFVAPGAAKRPQGRGRDAEDEERSRSSQPSNVDPEVLKNWFPLPPGVGDPESSGLTTTIATGQRLDIDLK